MSTPKRKNNINVYTNITELGKNVTDNRQKLLDRITKSDTYLPDSLLHDDLDMGMLDFVRNNFIITTDGEQIPIIPKILTLQRWGEFSSNWKFSDDDGNVKLPFIAVIRKPDVQPGTNPLLQRTIPDRMPFYYSSIPTWNGTQMGADIFKIPQPVGVDITFDVTIVCTKFRDLNRFNKVVLQKFSSRQAYTTIKGHYVPVILESVADSSPMDNLEGRRFYIQTYNIKLLGYLVDSDEFEVKPAISRAILTTEFISSDNFTRKAIERTFEIKYATFKGDGQRIYFSVGEKIVVLFYVEINGILQQRNVDYFFIPGTSRIVFTSPPYSNSTITIVYYKGSNMQDGFVDSNGQPLLLNTEFQPYIDGTLSYQTSLNFKDIIFVTLNGIIQEENINFIITEANEITFTSPAYPNTTIGISYAY